ncbi:hypothetical protein M514_01402 [Trichuris suis]|uniref:DNA-directed RNA polymerase III subunit n=1 Tax=Trichuris suis TaxID=68888 RepID=A0A085NRT7_9BILA|nr:hypothetical protein M514_01402 [Trichuris suis]
MPRAKKSHLLSMTRNMGTKRYRFNGQQAFASTELYPPLHMKPSPVNVDSVSLHIAFERGYVMRLQQLPYYHRPNTADLLKISNDRFLPYHRFPKELHPKSKLCQPSTSNHLKEIPKKLKALKEMERRKREDNAIDHPEAEKDSAEEEQPVVQVRPAGEDGEGDEMDIRGLSADELNEDDLEEENDYIDSYFDNGEADLEDESSSDEATFV